MSSVIGNPEIDFKSQNSILCQYGMFKKLYEDKDKDASKKCWSVFFIEEADDRKNPFIKLPKDSRIAEVKKQFYNIKTDSEEYKALARDYSVFALNKEQSLFRIHLLKLEELTVFLEDLSLDDDEQFKKYITIMDKLPRMWTSLESIKTKMIEVESKSNVRGNAQLGSREKRKPK